MVCKGKNRAMHRHLSVRRILLLAALSTSLALPTTARSFALAGPCVVGSVYDAACDVDHDGDVDVFDIQLTAGHWSQTGVFTADGWLLTGNAGTNAATNFLGTTDLQPLVLKVNNQPAFRLEPTGDVNAPNIIGGSPGNGVSAGVIGATISGGGGFPVSNSVTADFGTVSGGYLNYAGGFGASVGGGFSNTAGGLYASVNGGYSNTASGNNASVSGGTSNTAGGSGASVSGGYFNTASGSGANVSGGDSNTAGGFGASVSGGLSNTASGNRASVGGGTFNTASGSKASVGGGDSNTASGTISSVPGGSYALASHYGEMAHASGGFGGEVVGIAQASSYVLRREIPGNAGIRELFLDGSSERITLVANRALAFDVLIVARSNTGETSAWRVEGVVENSGGVTSLIGTPIKTTLGEDDVAWDVAVLADDANDALAVVGYSNQSGDTIRFVASVRTTEVAW